MKFKYFSANVIGCEDFLPPMHLQDIKIEILNNRKRFNISNWSASEIKNGNTTRIKDSDSLQFFNQNCGGLDYWIDYKEVLPDHEKITSLHKWFYSQGFFAFLDDRNTRDVFHLLKRPKKHKIHMVSYNNGGYYNWHTDSEFFTFNLILNQGNALTGGDLLFMDEGNIIQIPNKDNMMVLFPWYLNHSITPVKSKDGKDVAFPQQRFSVQYWVNLI